MYPVRSTYPCESGFRRDRGSAGGFRRRSVSDLRGRRRTEPLALYSSRGRLFPRFLIKDAQDRVLDSVGFIRFGRGKVLARERGRLLWPSTRRSNPEFEIADQLAAEHL